MTDNSEHIARFEAAAAIVRDARRVVRALADSPDGKRLDMDYVEQGFAIILDRLQADASCELWGNASEVRFNAGETTFTGINTSLVLKWVKVCPDVMVSLEIERAAQWVASNPKKGRKRNYRAFLTRWMNRCQREADAARNRPGLVAAKPGKYSQSRQS